MFDDDSLWPVALLLLVIVVALIALVDISRNMGRCERNGGTYIMRVGVCLARGAVMP